MPNKTLFKPKKCHFCSQIQMVSQPHDVVVKFNLNTYDYLIYIRSKYMSAFNEFYNNKIKNIYNEYKIIFYAKEFDNINSGTSDNLYNMISKLKSNFVPDFSSIVYFVDLRYEKIYLNFRQLNVHEIFCLKDNIFNFGLIFFETEKELMTFCLKFKLSLPSSCSSYSVIKNY